MRRYKNWLLNAFVLENNFSFCFYFVLERLHFYIESEKEEARTHRRNRASVLLKRDKNLFNEK